MPSLDRAFVFPDHIPAEAHAGYLKKHNDTIAALRTNPSSIPDWFNLAIEYRTVGDYEGAVEVYEYVSAANPTEPISVRNLGEYYFHNVKDYVRAEEYYRRSIAIDSTMSVNYSDLHEMYRYATNEPEKAVQILEEGIKNIERNESIDLIIMGASFYRDQGNVVEARTQYNRARVIASELRNYAVVQMIDQELARLK